MKLSIGTAQFGLDYGVANSEKKYSQDAVNNLIKLCRSHEVLSLDTAINYGDSETKLGKAEISDFQIVTKLPSIPESSIDIKKWIINQVLSSLNRLNVSSVHGILLHDPSQLHTDLRDRILNSLETLQRDGYVKKIGISVYSPQEIEKLSMIDTFEIIQAPFNIMDRRLDTSGMLNKLSTNGVEIHVRSIFLQGLLVMNPAKRPDYFKKWSHLLSIWDNWIVDNNLNPIEVCINFIKQFSQINNCVVGVDNLHQCHDLISIFSNEVSYDFPKISSEDTNLVNPGNWKF